MTKTKSGTGSMPLGDNVIAHFGYTNTVSDTDMPGIGTYFYNLTFTGYGDMFSDLSSYTYVKDAYNSDLLVTWENLFIHCTDEEITIPDTITSLGDGLFERPISTYQARVHETLSGSKYVTYDDVSCYDDHNGSTPVTDYRALHYIKKVIVGDHVTHIGGRCFSGGYAAYANRHSNYVGDLSENTWADEDQTVFTYWIGTFTLENDIEIKYSASPCIAEVEFKNPEIIEYLGGEAFAGCVDLAELDFKDHTPETIGERVFASCFNLERVTFDRRLALGSGFFYNCFKLSYFNKYNEISEVDGGCMVGCLSLLEVAFTLDCRLDGQYVQNSSIMHVKPEFATNPSKSKKQITYIHGNSCWPCCRAWMYLDNRTIIYDDGLGRGWPTLYYYNYKRLYRVGLSPQPFRGDNVKQGEYTKYYPYYIEGRIWYATVKSDGDNPMCEVYDIDSTNFRNFFDSEYDVNLGEMISLFLR